jgi:hypothetical protein
VPAQVANGEIPYKQFKKEFIDVGKEAEKEAMKIVGRMEEAQDQRDDGSDLNVKHMVEIEEVRSMHMHLACTESSVRMHLACTATSARMHSACITSRARMHLACTASSAHACRSGCRMT